jgi:hypothetical protein
MNRGKRPSLAKRLAGGKTGKPVRMRPFFGWGEWLVVVIGCVGMAVFVAMFFWGALG